ncbi:hypothetical protein [Streptomyces sp. NPDC002467]|uniref:hypothetical protein n=1 Tax=Streptomyces sp. NPDC002467 TaxID=3364647 RepID=UPI00368B876B
MAVPDIHAELQIGSLWSDVTNDAVHEAAIRYAWGRRGEGERTDPASAPLAFLNPTGKYSPRNPLSPYYRQLGRNTPLRLSHGGADVALVVPAGTASRATTPDTAALDIVGDIDVRADLTPAAWGTTSSELGWAVMGKWTDFGQQSWMLGIGDDGRIGLYWSTDGFNILSYGSDVAVPFAPGQRGAIRVTLDVDNGLGGFTATYYTAPTMVGPWVQLGTPDVTTSGTTSIFNSTSALEVGDLSGTDWASIAREYHAIEVRTGIGGSAVATPVFTGQASGTTSFADSAGRTWSAGTGLITNRRTRAVLETADWAPRSTTAGLVTAPVTGAGILRRLGRGQKPLSSTLRRTLPKIGAGPVAYWPLEDGSTSTQVASALSGGRPLTVSDMSFAADSSCPGASPLPTIGAAATMVAAVPPYTSINGSGYTISMMYSLDAMPASKSTILSFGASGDSRGVVISLTATQIVCDVYGPGGALITSSSFTPAAASGADRWWRLTVAADGIGIPNTTFVYGLVDDLGNEDVAGVTVAGAPGIVTYIDTAFGALLSGMAVGHLVVYPDPFSTGWRGADRGYAGEEAGARLLRLCGEEGIPVTIADGPGAHTRLGPQRPAKLLDLLDEIAAADGGILYEDRGRLGLVYRTRNALYSQAPKVTIPFGQLGPPLDPTDDDKYVRNDRTVSRVDGSSARAILTAGALSTAPPPAGVGLYDDSTTVNVYSDGQLPDIAAWLLHRGTWDEARYPKLRILLHKYPALVPAVSALQPGDVIRITDLPSWLPPGPVDLMVEGGDEEFKQFEWTVTLACSPAGPWSVAVLDDSVLGRLDTDGSVLVAAATTTATTLLVDTVQTSAGVPRWTEDPAECPIDMKLGGETVTATAIAPYATDTYTRTVSNGWGSTTSGLAWATANGSASDRSVASGRGVVTLAASPTVLRFQVLPDSVGDCEIRAALSVSATATGASLTSSVVMRYTSPTDYYRLRLQFTTAGTIVLTVHRDATQIDASVTPGVSYTPGSLIQARVRLVGHRVLGRVWATGDPEPTTWQIDRTVTSSTITAGQVGFGAGAVSGNTNVAPEIRYDDLVVVGPQRMTVSRSVNGIVKAQPAGTDIRLANPMIVAL